MNYYKLLIVWYFCIPERVFTVEGPFKIDGIYTFNLKVWSDNPDVIPVSETQNVFITGDVKEKIILK